MSVLEKFSNIKLNRKGYHAPDNAIEINGKKLEGFQNVKIEYGLDNPVPVVTIQFLANEIKGKIETAQGVIEKK